MNGFVDAGFTSFLFLFLFSFNNDNGSKTAKGVSFLISSATFGGSLSALCRYQEIDLVWLHTLWISVSTTRANDTEPTVLLIWLEGFLHRCFIRLTTIVSFPAFTRMLSALRTVDERSFKSVSSISRKPRLSSWFSCRASLDKESTMTIVGLDL